MEEKQLKGLQDLRKPIPQHLISQFPSNAGQKSGLDYINHAVVTDRLLSTDPEWHWEFHTADGLPAFDEYGGMFIKLTVCGVTRIGYGDKGNAKGADAIKNAISDAIKNAAMRFGVALELWTKEELHETKTPGSKDTLNELDLKLIDALADHRRDHIGFDAKKFANWIKQSFKCESYDTMQRAALKDVLSALISAPRGTEWPNGCDPRKDDVLNNAELTELFNKTMEKQK
jgi:hypothetical protein